MVNPIIFHIIRKRFANGLAGKMFFLPEESINHNPSVQRNNLFHLLYHRIVQFIIA